MDSCSRAENVKLKEIMMVSLVDLPESILEDIFERLSPADLCSMARVCSFLRGMCTNDYMWEKQLKRRWGKLIDDAAYREWKSHLASRNELVSNTSDQKKKKGLFECLYDSRPLSWIRLKVLEKSLKSRTSSALPIDSIMAFYLSLESGKFWFPAQIFYGENGYRGDMLLCYDAHARYDSRTNTFQARYPPQGCGRTEANIEWDRLRAPKVDTPLYMLHVSDCLNDLKPGDHIEIQWTSHKDLPYGWWYAVIGHLETCDGSENHCRCQYNETIVVDFNQYPPSSIWRRTKINRKYHPEEGNRADGFYGGIRKLCDEGEIAKWLGFWPTDVDNRNIYFPLNI